MSTSEPFYAQRRLRELRGLIRQADSFDHRGAMNEAMIALLEDMANHLASRADGDQDEAFAFIIRCMGAVAEANAATAYALYGYDNPFEAAVPAIVPAPSMPVWKWPVVNRPPTGAGGGLNGAVFKEYSALKMFGYTVGKTNGWPKADRQAFLRDFMTMALPPIVKATFGDDYGSPMSTDRLRKVANIIASNASLRYRNDPDRYEHAIVDWEDDLAFLKRTYYETAGLKFQPWPTSRPL